jgi:hypothetical protein
VRFLSLATAILCFQGVKNNASTEYDLRRRSHLWEVFLIVVRSTMILWCWRDVWWAPRRELSQCARYGRLNYAVM